MKTCCIIIPIYQSKLTYLEQQTLKNYFKVLSNYDIYVICPQHLISFINTKLNCKYIAFEDKYFKSIPAYSQLLTTTKFYEKFANYQYMLIAQLDAWIYYDNLQYFIDLNYDWYGSPLKWKRSYYHCGNGGFNLRRISKMIEICNLHHNKNYNQPEDYFFCIHNEDKLNCCDIVNGINFCYQGKRYNDELLQYIDESRMLPMAVHHKITHEYFGCNQDGIQKLKNRIVYFKLKNRHII